MVLSTAYTLSLLLSRQKNEKNYNIEGFVIQIRQPFFIKVAPVESTFRTRIRQKFVTPSVHCYLSLFSPIFSVLSFFQIFPHSIEVFFGTNLNARW